MGPPAFEICVISCELGRFVEDVIAPDPSLLSPVYFFAGKATFHFFTIFRQYD